MRILKYPLEEPDTIIDMPQTAAVLSVGEQDGGIVIWCNVDPASKTVSRRFRCYNTGKDVDGGAYVGTVVVKSIVWHVFDLGFAYD